MKKLVATRALYSLVGKDKEYKDISYCNGTIEFDGKEVFAYLLEKAQEHRSNVAHIQVLSLNPLEFKEVEDGS